jgi:hypothetical protein
MHRQPSVNASIDDTFKVPEQEQAQLRRTLRDKLSNSGRTPNDADITKSNICNIKKNCSGMLTGGQSKPLFASR